MPRLGREPGEVGAWGTRSSVARSLTPEARGTVAVIPLLAAPACGRPAHRSLWPSPAQDALPGCWRGGFRQPTPVPSRRARVQVGSRTRTPPCLGSGSRGCEGHPDRGEGDTCGKPKAQHPVPREEIAALSLPSGPGLQWGLLWSLGGVRLAFPSHPRPTSLRSWASLPAAAGGGCLRSDPPRGGSGIAHRLPQANFVHFRVSLLCKLQVLRGAGELQPPAPSLSLDVPGSSVAPPVSPRDLEGPQEQKPRQPALTVRGAVAEPG